MVIRLMRFEKLMIDNHVILRVLLDSVVIELAKAQAALKARHINCGDPSGRQRGAAEVDSQNFLGTLADLVCARILVGYFRKYHLSIGVTRYDDVRTDDFKDHDQYDIKLSSAEADYLVEIRSSVCIYLSLQAMIRKWQILGHYITDAKGETETAKPFYLRPLYHLSTFAENRQTQSYQRTSAVELIQRGDLQLYFVGGATHDLMMQHGRNEAGQELKQGRAQFRVLNIMDGLDAQEILQTIAGVVVQRKTIRRSFHDA